MLKSLLRCQWNLITETVCLDLSEAEIVLGQLFGMSVPRLSAQAWTHRWSITRPASTSARAARVLRYRCSYRSIQANSACSTIQSLERPRRSAIKSSFWASSSETRAVTARVFAEGEGSTPGAITASSHTQILPAAASGYSRSRWAWKAYRPIQWCVATMKIPAEASLSPAAVSPYSPASWLLRICAAEI